MKTKREAEKEVRKAFERFKGFKDASEQFAKVCQRAHTFLSDSEIARVIDNEYSRSNIQQLRKKAAKIQDKTKK